jgi:hypothetical protein
MPGRTPRCSSKASRYPRPIETNTPFSGDGNRISVTRSFAVTAIVFCG